MKNEKKEIRYFSMFTGVGGFELGFERANDLSKKQRTQQRRDEIDLSDNKQELFSAKQFTCIGFSEIDKYANELLKQKFPNIKNYGDARKINPKELPDFDMLCGGFPCQTFSIAGKRKGFQDTRGTLFFEIARIVKIKRPKIILLENVKGLLNHNKGQTFSIIIQTLSELGYDVQWMVLNSKFFGVPQNRERVFIIGSLRGKSRPEILPFRESSEFTNERISETENASSLQSPGHTCGNYRGMNMISKTIRKGGRGSLDDKHNWDIIRVDRQEGRDREYARIYSTEGISPTLHLKTGGWQEPKVAIPVLTPDRENKRQHGRRFKEDGEESFTLTRQDIHGVAIIRGRPKIPYEHGNRELIYSIYENEVPTLSQNCGSGDQKNMIMNTIQEAVGTRAGSSASFKKSVENIYNSTMKIRRLTPTECERLQGFSDNWTEGFSDTQRYKMMGNAVTVNVIKAIAEKIVK